MRPQFATMRPSSVARVWICGDDLSSERFWRLDFFEAAADGELRGAVCFKPVRQFRVVTTQRQCLDHFRVLGSRRPRPVGQQNLFGFLLRGHDSVRFAFVGKSLANIFCSCAMPREIRDLTVPSGSSSIAAISL